MAALDGYLADPAHPRTGALFRDRRFHHRLSDRTAFELVKTIGRHAGVAAADRMSPHSLRHTFITEALRAGAALQAVQDAAGHADSRTTRAYDHYRDHLDSHPTYLLAAHLPGKE